MKTKTSDFCLKLSVVTLMLASVTALIGPAFAQGNLTPPGAPIPTMKTLDQIEPRRDVAKLSGDGSSLHVIDQPGSYYLSTNIFGAASKNGISIRTNNVTLDLGGFALIGGASSLDGINGSAGFHTNCVVFNGIVSGWTNGYGVYLANLYGGRLENLTVANNNYAGLTSGRQTIVQNCVAQFNKVDGIFVQADASVRHCFATGNGSAGIHVVESGARIENNEASRNAYGIRSVGSANLIIKNFAVQNSGSVSNYVYTGNDLVGPLYGTFPGIITTNSPWANFSR